MLVGFLNRLLAGGDFEPMFSLTAWLSHRIAYEAAFCCFAFESKLPSCVRMMYPFSIAVRIAAARVFRSLVLV